MLVSDSEGHRGVVCACVCISHGCVCVCAYNNTLCINIEFIHLLASEANEICERENKKTIAGEHVVSALQALGFEDYVEEVDEVYKEHKKQQKVGVVVYGMLFFHR